MKTIRVDFHTHWDPAVFGISNNDPARFFETMDRHGLDQAVLLPIRGLLDASQIPQDNNDLAECGRVSRGRLIPLGTVNIWQKEEALHEARRCFEELDLAGLKFHPWLQGASVNLPVMDEICQLAAAFNKIIYFHDGTPPFSLPSQIGMLAHRHPEVRFVLGHCGLLEFWREALMVLQATKNVWGCICGPTHAAARTLWREGPQDRLVWGSDFGFGIADHMEYRLQELRAWRLTAEEEARLISENPTHFLQNRFKMR